MGGMNSMYGSGYGGMNSMYGGGGMFGSGMNNMGGMQGQPNPNDPNSMTNNFAMSTQATFQIIESIVGAFGGFAQMLESTYMATHSSFYGTSVSLSLLSTLTQRPQRLKRYPFNANVDTEAMQQ